MEADRIQQLQNEGLISCFWNRVDNPGAIWNSENVLIFYLPSLVLQILLVVFATRLMFWILRPLHQPHFVAELLVSPCFSLSASLQYTFTCLEDKPLCDN